MSIPMLDLDAQYAPIADQVRAAIDAVLRSHRYIGGPEVDALERELADYCGVAHAIGVSSGTDALVVSLLALGVGPGDEVITTPFSFFATAGSVWRRGAKLRFVDIDPDTFNLNLAQVKAALNARTRAIIPVHLFGQAVDIVALRAIVGSDVKILEDCAQAIGAEHLGKRVGSQGDLGAFSFFPSKNLGGIGDGGLVTTNNTDFATRVRLLRNHGQGAQYVHEIVGGNFRLDALNAAVLRVKLPHLDVWTEARRRNAERYRHLIEAAGLLDRGLKLPRDPGPEHRHIYNQFVVRLQQRDAVKQALDGQGIGCAVYYPIPLHLQACFEDLGYQRGAFPEAEKASQEVLALPIYPELRDDQAETVIACIRSVLQ